MSARQSLILQTGKGKHEQRRGSGLTQVGTKATSGCVLGTKGEQEWDKGRGMAVVQTLEGRLHTAHTLKKMSVVIRVSHLKRQQREGVKKKGGYNVGEALENNGFKMIQKRVEKEWQRVGKG